MRTLTRFIITTINCFFFLPSFTRSTDLSSLTRSAKQHFFVKYKTVLTRDKYHVDQYCVVRVMSFTNVKRRSVSPSFSWRYTAHTADYAVLHRGDSVPCRTSTTGRPHRCPSAKVAAALAASRALPRSPGPEPLRHLLAAPDGATAALLIYRKICACHLQQRPK